MSLGEKMGIDFWFCFTQYNENSELALKTAQKETFKNRSGSTTLQKKTKLIFLKYCKLR